MGTGTQTSDPELDQTLARAIRQFIAEAGDLDEAASEPDA